VQQAEGGELQVSVVGAMKRTTCRYQCDLAEASDRREEPPHQPEPPPIYTVTQCSIADKSDKLKAKL